MKPTDWARDIMDNACLPEFLVKNGADKAIRSSIAKAITEAVAEADKKATMEGYELGLEHGEKEENKVCAVIAVSLRHTDHDIAAAIRAII